MSVARARELAEAWRAGALRPDEERELQALLLDGGVLEAVPTDEELAREAAAIYRRPNLDSVPGTWWQWYAAGARREGCR